MKRWSLPLIAAASLVALPVLGQSEAQPPEGMPWFMVESTPPATQQAAWDEYRAVYGDNTAVPAKYKQLMAIAVAAQVPCDYCVYAHTAQAKKAGATEEEIKEALAVAGQVRKWSTIVNGAQIDFDKFKSTIDEVAAAD